MITINNLEDIVKLLDDKPQWLQLFRARLLDRKIVRLPQTLARFTSSGEPDESFNPVLTASEVDGTDFTSIREMFARGRACYEALIIAKKMGFTFTKVLSGEDVIGLCCGKNTSGIPADDYRRFRNAMLHLEVTNEQGSNCYVAVESGFVVTREDAAMAVRSAGYLTELTGRPAFAAVAGVYRDERIQASLDSGAVFWYQLRHHSLFQ